VLLDGLVEIVRDRGSVCLLEEVSLSADERVAEAADDALDNGLHVAAEAPQTRGNIPESKAGEL
jgi:hypothetical protein